MQEHLDKTHETKDGYSAVERLEPTYIILDPEGKVHTRCKSLAAAKDELSAIIADNNRREELLAARQPDAPVVTLQLRGPRLIEAAEEMLGKPTPEEVDPSGEEWGGLGVSVQDGILTIPALLLNDFIEECEYAALQAEDFGAKALARGLKAIADKLRARSA